MCVCVCVWGGGGGVGGVDTYSDIIISTVNIYELHVYMKSTLGNGAHRS